MTTEPVPEMVGTQEAARILGVPRARVRRVLEPEGVAPTQELGSGPIWLKADVVAARDTREGRIASRAEGPPA